MHDLPIPYLACSQTETANNNNNMASFISRVKRKLTAFLPFSSPSDEATPTTAEPPRKRQRIIRDDGIQTPLLRSSSPFQLPNPLLEPPESILLPPAFDLSEHESFSSEGDRNEPSDLLRLLSNDVLSRCLSYIATRSDRFALQTSCKTFRRLSDADDMLVNIDLCGDWTSALTSNTTTTPNRMNNNFNRGNNDQNADDINVREMTIAFPHGRLVSNTDRGILTDSDTSVTACSKLIKYVSAGNLQAIYMTAMLLCYCHENVSEGIALLRLARDAGHLPSTYALALILRDSRHAESDYCLRVAINKNYPPAWQEKLSATEMRAQFGGDLDASKLLHYLDPPCLNRLLGRHYLECHRVRKNQTSHCWNPLCGRWAYKATSPIPQRHQLGRGMEGLLEPFHLNDMNFNREQVDDDSNGLNNTGFEGIFRNRQRVFSIESMLPHSPAVRSPKAADNCNLLSPNEKIRQSLESKPQASKPVSRMKMCSSCRRAKYCSKLCQVYDWRSGRHKLECQFL